jgi:hypothetical protein
MLLLCKLLHVGQQFEGEIVEFLESLCWFFYGPRKAVVHEDGIEYLLSR